MIITGVMPALAAFGDRAGAPPAAAGRSGRRSRGTSSSRSTVAGARSAGHRRPVAPRDGQHAQAVAGHPLGLRDAAPRRRSAPSPSRASALRAALDHALRRALGERDDAVAPPRTRCSVVMHLRSESNGSSATRGSRALQRRPCRSPLARRDVAARSRSDRRRRRRARSMPASLQSASAGSEDAPRRVRERAASGIACRSSPSTKNASAGIRFCVSVPVLSEQM